MTMTIKQMAEDIKVLQKARQTEIIYYQKVTPDTIVTAARLDPLEVRLRNGTILTHDSLIKEFSITPFLDRFVYVAKIKNL